VNTPANRLRQIARVCGLLVIVTGITAIAGWLAGLRVLTSLGADLIPMAPNTALSFIVMGFSLLFILSSGNTSRWFARLGALLVTIISALRIAEELVGFDLAVDYWIFNVPSETLGLTPVGRMALFTAASFCMLGGSIFLLTAKERQRTAEDLAGSLATLVASIGTMFCIGYAIGNPLFYGGATIPMALNTAAGFFLMGGAVLLIITSRDVERAKDGQAWGLGLSIDRKVLAGFGMALAMVLVVSMVSYNNTLKLMETTREANRIHQMLTELEATISLIKDMETGTRGYVITASPEFLEPHRFGVHHVADRLDRLKSLTQDDRVLLHHIDSLESHIDRLIEFHERIHRLRDDSGFDAAYDLIASEPGKSLMDEIRAVGRTIEEEEKKVLGMREAEREASLQKSLLALSTLLLIVVLILAVIYVVIRRDLTGRQRAEEKLRKVSEEIKDLYNNAPCGYHSLDRNGTFVAVNDTELSWLGYSRDEVVGKMGFRDVLTPASVRRFEENFPVFKERGYVRDLEFEMQRKDGVTFHVSLSSTAIRDAEGTYLSSRSTMFDITDRKRAAEEIRKLNRDLARRAAELETANKELDAFSYSVSHDLRSPLRSIDGFSKILLEKHSKGLDDQGIDYLARVRAATLRMAQLIDDLLNLSRITRVAMKTEAVDLSAMAQLIVKELHDAHPHRNVECNVEDGLVQEGDPNLLRIVLENLLGNAWKYTRNHQKAKIEFGKEHHGNEYFYFVRDNGAGFDMQYADKLFGAFQRLHRVTEFEGTGVGLAIVARIISRHGGRVWASGEVNQGATFYFSF
jgi:PAS domain S-box-containing protein